MFTSPRPGGQAFRMQQQLGDICQLDIVGGCLADALDKYGMIRGNKMATCTSEDIRRLE